MALVALALVGVIAMAALSIDVGTLYEASTEAQRSADTAALAAARVLSLSGLTGDPQNSSGLWQQACTLAQNTAQDVANLNTVGGQVPSGVTTTFFSSDAGSATPSSCSAPGAFGVNPMVTVKVTQKNLPTFFAKIFGLLKGYNPTTVSASATAEAFNPSASENFNSGTGTLVPVQPSCVKPWIVPNLDPGSGGTKPFVSVTDGAIQNPGIQVSGAGTGVIGETFTLEADCTTGGAGGTKCNNGGLFSLTPTASSGTLQYVPGQVPGSLTAPAGAPPVAIPSCANADAYQQAIAGCDQTTQYQCGVSSANAANPNYVDLTENPVVPPGSGDTYTAAQCLTNQLSGTPDSISTAVYPYQITAGSGNPLNAGTGAIITSSNSIASLPIYTTGAGNSSLLAPNGQDIAPVTIVGFLQVFIQQVNSDGSLLVYVMNVAGCGNGSGAVNVASPALQGTSPVPIRLVTPPTS
jgi:Putative Flp pilus-assembly TadE/G-like/Putative Tad-like Flp pilus-assembly